MRGWEEVRGPRVLEELATMTGGQHHMVNKIAELPDLALRMSLALHDRYLVGYRPTPPGVSGTVRKIDVQLVLPKGPRSSTCTVGAATACPEEATYAVYASRNHSESSN